jgi:carotenoid cleavage dioxygenase
MTRSDRQGPPWAIGFRSVLDERISARLDPHAGRLPAGLRGVFYRNGPGRHDLGGRRYRHWFDGDGLIHAFRFTDSGVAHHARFVETRKHAAERAAGRFLYAAFGTRFRGARLRADPEGLNTANTNVLPHHGRLLALWEGGAAHALDPDTLDTDGPVAWSDDTAGQPFSAHPRVEPDGTLWNFGVNPAEGTLILYEIAPDGRLRRARRIRLGATPMVHDFAVTERHLAFLLPPLHFRLHRLMAGASILGSYRWEPRHGLRALVIDKTDWDRQHWFQLPAGFVFHFGGAWDDGAGLRLDYERYPDPGVVKDFARRVMDGKAGGFQPPAATQLHLDLHRGTAEERTLAPGSEFPALHPGHVGRRYRYRYAASTTGARNHPFQNAVSRLDLESGGQQIYSFGPDTVAEEHIVVPRPDGRGESDAWLLGTVLDTAAERSRLTVFDAAAVDAGPVFEAQLDRALPLGFHGSFKAAS